MGKKPAKNMRIPKSHSLGVCGIPGKISATDPTINPSITRYVGFG